MARAYFRPNPAGIQQLYYRPDGPVQTYCAKLAQDVAELAEQLCPKGEDKENWQGVLVHTGGSLAASITVIPLPGGRWGVYALEPYAAAVHNGKRAHDVSPRNVDHLRFETAEGEVVFTTKTVTIPARAGQPFLRDALVQVIQ